MDHYVFSGLTNHDQQTVQTLLSRDVSFLIRKAIHKVLGIKPEQLQSAARYRHYVDARQMYFSLLRRATDLSLKEIGSTVNRHHSTVIHSLREHKNKVQYDIPYQQAYTELCSEISILINNKHVQEEA